MISREIFEDKFTEMFSLLNRTVTARQMKSWYRRIEGLDNQAFASTVEWFVQTSQLPNWADFMKAYANEGSKLGLNRERGCEWCDNGFVYFWKKYKRPDHWGRKHYYECAIRCGLCNEGRDGSGYDAQSNISNLNIANHDDPDNDPNPPYPPVPEINPVKAEKGTVDEMVLNVGKPVPKLGNFDQRVAVLRAELENQAKEIVDEEFPYF